MGKSMRARAIRRSTLIVIVAMLMASAVPMLVADVQLTLMAKRHQAVDEIAQIQAAVRGYYARYAKYPFAPNNAMLVRLLNGTGPSGNERGITFITFPASDYDMRGELLDPWNTPLQLSVTGDGVLHARSAGADTVFGTSDDITN